MNYLCVLDVRIIFLSDKQGSPTGTWGWITSLILYSQFDTKSTLSFQKERVVSRLFDKDTRYISIHLIVRC